MKKKLMYITISVCMFMAGCSHKSALTDADATFTDAAATEVTGTDISDTATATDAAVSNAAGNTEGIEIRYVVIDNEVNTYSELKTSYTDSVKDYDMVVYLGHPRQLEGTEQWSSEDINILSINSNNEATAWKEGTVQISDGNTDCIVYYI